MTRLAFLALFSFSAPLLDHYCAAEGISFDRDIRPILSENCFHCHGPDAGNREADLALHDAGSAAHVIVAGDPESSELITRIYDTEDPMPPSDSNRTLTDQQREMLRVWVASGAKYQTHWAFELPQKALLPGDDVDENPIDRFVAAQLKDEGLALALPADRQVLARRASLALTGLQPIPSHMQAFLADKTSGAYEQFVDRLLASDDYAERMTLLWLDAARYADTDGYQNDNQRQNWPWRDWVIAAYRDNMPFDQFTIEQLAGDMLPEATHQQRLASAFNRNHRQNGESGALADEYFVENVIDRVETTSTVWLGLTTGCARCHDHKYDPISQREFYQLFAYFNNIGERGIGRGSNANPILLSTSPIRAMPQVLADKQQSAKQALQSARQTIQPRLDEWTRQFSLADLTASVDWHAIEPADEVTVTADGKKHEIIPQPDGTYEFEKYSSKRVDYDVSIKTAGERLSGLRLNVLPTARFGAEARFAPSANGNFVVSNVTVKFIDHRNKKQNVAIAHVEASYEQLNYAATNLIDDDPQTGWAVYGADSRGPIQLRLQFKSPIPRDAKGKLSVTLEHSSPYANHTIAQLRLAFTTHPSPVSPPAEVMTALLAPPEERSDEQLKAIREFYTPLDAEISAAKSKLTAVNNEIRAAGYGDVPVMVMNESKTIRPTYLLNRGQYDDPEESETLSRTVPAALLTNKQSPPRDRLELARWLMSRDNPITARVVVNRMWQSIFGLGLVKTAEDFGAQGERPSNPELLDWLAVDFIDSGWDVKRLYRLIVTSRTFRQSSRMTPSRLERDPENRLLARGPRFRMDGFALRDMALLSAGLLNSEIGGAPVKPYQPRGLWSSVGNSASDRYVQDQGAKLYRKSMYTYWRRAVNPPRQTIFDASGREVCNVRHRVTNTPLQALALMNDETFIEAARHLAARMIKEGGDNTNGRLTYGYQLVTSYLPQAKTHEILASNLAFFLQHFGKQKQTALEYLSSGDSPSDASLDPSEHAAYTATAHLMLNMDEAIVME